MPISEELELYFLDIAGCVEATDFERHCLWDFNDRVGKRQWKETGHGYLPTIGQINADNTWLPITISVLTAVIDDHKILFYHSPSRVTDHDAVRKWLDTNMPKTAFREDEWLNNTNAQNFCNVFNFGMAKILLKGDRVKIKDYSGMEDYTGQDATILRADDGHGGFVVLTDDDKHLALRRRHLERVEAVPAE